MHIIESHNLIINAGNPWAYQLAVIVAAIIGGAFIRHDSRTWTLSKYSGYWLLGVAALGSLVGCAIPAYFAGGLVQKIAVTSIVAPKTILGGILFGFIFIVIYKKVTKNGIDTSDAFARGTICMMFIGRLGCIAQHCCYGDITTTFWGMQFGDGQMRIPVQYIEASGLFILTTIIFWLHYKDYMKGRRLFVIFAIYGVMRFILEYLRAPISESISGIGFYQWLSLLLALTGVFQTIKRTLNPITINHQTQSICAQGKVSI